MGQAVLIIGLLFIVIGLSVTIYRIKNYKNRIGNPNIYTLPGVPPGTFSDKLFYIGTAVLFSLVGVFFVVESFLGFGGK
ncbi:hypothetical protein GCM10007359_21710 [Rothia aerolata]|uniref:Uncharacterized protein n=1 Tax=Rothia aerolata TaxID=1812262 RepID=A0A917IZ67_9MICC|nr:hypothetical protein GCM10007359_21710 [Rothia aerolata]